MTDSEPTRVRVRRMPKLRVFLTLGGVLGAVAAVALSLAFPATSDYPMIQVIAFTGVIGVAVGIAVGGTVALLLDRRAERRSRVVEARRRSGD